MSKSTLVQISVELVHETEKAWLLNDGTQKVWFPKSWGELEKAEDGTTYVLETEESKAIEKELI